MNNNEPAFFDSNLYIMNDIPARYLNMMNLKSHTKFDEEEIEFDVNVPTSVFIAINMQEPMILDPSWKDT